MNDKYNSFANIHDIKIATVYRMAIDNGWQPPKDPNYKPTPQAKPQTTQTQPQAQTQLQGIDVFTPLIACFCSCVIFSQFFDFSC